MTHTYEFVGGPLDGERRTLPGGLYTKFAEGCTVRVPVQGPAGTVTHVYEVRQRTLVYAGPQPD